MNYLMLRINLSNRSHEVEEISPEIIRKYIGGRGLGAYLLYKSMPPKADPFGQENHRCARFGIEGANWLHLEPSVLERGPA